MEVDHRPEPPVANPPRWTRDVHVAAWLARNKVAIVISMGIACRVAQFLSGRGFWMDEQSLAINVQQLNPLGFFGPLRNAQLAPPGFLILEWLATRVFGTSYSAFRLVPLVAGVASLFLLRSVARLCLPRQAVWVAVGMFAISDDLIYFATEAKQYSTDVTSALGCLLLALTVDRGRLTPSRAVGLGGFGTIVVWFSHPSIFVLASVGVVGLARAIRSKDERSALFWVACGVSWVTSFAWVHVVASEQLGHQSQMWSFWEFAFPPIPPRSLWDTTWFLRRFALLFVNPLNFDQPVGPSLSFILPLGLFLVGCGQIGRADRGRLALLLLPVGFVMLASTFQLYPFHGRLVLFIVPSLLLGVAAGLEAFRGRKILYAILLTSVLGLPTWTALYRMVEPRQRLFANPFGDNRAVVIDPYRFPF